MRLPGTGNGCPGASRAFARPELPPQLKCEERIPTGHFVQPRDLRPREIEPEPLLQKLMETAEAERADRQPLQVVEVERQADARPLSQGREEADPLVAQPPKRELEHASRGRVEPLGVVDGDEDGPMLGERAEHVEKRERDRALIRSFRARLPDEQSAFERTPTRAGECSQSFVEPLPEQIGESGERERRLRLGGAAGQDAPELPSGPVNAGMPENRLADTRLARNDQRGRPVPNSPQKGLDRVELFLPPDDRRSHHRLGIVNRAA
jgi:hypothetical protein